MVITSLQFILLILKHLLELFKVGTFKLFRYTEFGFSPSMN